MRILAPLKLSLLLALIVSGAGAKHTRAQALPPTPVVAVPATERNVPPSLRLVGSVRPYRSSVIAAEVSGVVATYTATEGQYLEPGDTICRLNNTVPTLRLNEAQATLDSLLARLNELENGERPEELARLAAIVAETDAEVGKWEFERKRVNGLFERGQCSEKEQHDTEMEYLVAVQRQAQAQAALDKARNGTRPEILAQAKQAVGAQQAVVQRMIRDVNKTEIRAPFAGALVSKLTEAGQWIEEGGAVCELVALDNVKIRVDVPERAIPFARVGAPATVEVEALGRTLAGEISRVIPLASPAARTFPVEIDEPNADHTLLPGMFVWAYVPAGPAGLRVMVTKDAIVPQGTTKVVYVIRPGADGGQMAIPTTVTTGLEFEGDVEVQAPDLKAGDLVVSRANERLNGPTPVVVSAQPVSQPAGATRPAE